ncbi:hypothetical protein CENSYa_0664 [Cenarchaeum symbiosum A]|uniref:Uncharacterized protein n=1 Tax=Cenarchaeum symbiosum (strain A) TaxID=414004 RepID=A0RVD0_CENSY|nr:hypothetical protein CENSYa_0664 [Cenarchaeum symbiosum A]
MVMIFALVGLVISLSGVIEDTYMTLAFGTPGFGYYFDGGGEHGNASFDAFVQMRYVAVGLLAGVFVWAAISRVLENAEMGLAPGTSNKVISRSLIFLLIFLVFPPMWDGISESVDGLSLWVLNPLYSYDEGSPCPIQWYDDPERILEEYVSSPYVPERDKVQARLVLDKVDPGDAVPWSGDGIIEQVGERGAPVTKYEAVCEYRLKVSYVFGNMIRPTEVADLRENAGIDLGTSDWIGELQNDVAKGIEGAFTNAFLGLTKALVSIQVLILSLLIGVMTDMFTSMVIAAFPVFAMLTLVPKIDQVAGRFIDALPALLLLPLLSAIVLSVGAGAVVQAAEHSEPAISITEDAFGNQTIVQEPRGAGLGHIYVWITALGVVFFSISLPVMLVPMLQGAVTMTTQVVGSAVQTSAMVTGMAAAGFAGGMKNAAKTGGGRAAMMMGGMQGMGRGLLHGHGGVAVPALGGVALNPAALGHQIASGYQQMPHGEQYSSIAEQDAAIARIRAAQADRGHTEENASGLRGSGAVEHEWDKSMTDSENRNEINKELAGAVNEGRISPEQLEQLNKWRGDDWALRNMERPADGNVKEYVDSSIKDDAGGDARISEQYFAKRIHDEMAEMRGASADEIKGMLKDNDYHPGYATGEMSEAGLRHRQDFGEE